MCKSVSGISHGLSLRLPVKKEKKKKRKKKNRFSPWGLSLFQAQMFDVLDCNFGYVKMSTFLFFFPFFFFFFLPRRHTVISVNRRANSYISASSKNNNGNNNKKSIYFWHALSIMRIKKILRVIFQGTQKKKKKKGVIQKRTHYYSSLLQDIITPMIFQASLAPIYIQHVHMYKYGVLGRLSCLLPDQVRCARQVYSRHETFHNLISGRSLHKHA